MSIEVGPPIVDEKAEVLIVVVDALDVGAQAAFGIDDVPRILLVGVWLKLVGLEGVNLFLCKHMYIIPYLRTTGVASMHRARLVCGAKVGKL